MNSNCKVIPIKLHSEEWHKFREGGIGGSEMAVILNLNEYKAAARLFHEKIGSFETWKEDKEILFHGRNHEDYVGKLWEYWNGSTEGLMENYKNDTVHRRCKNVNGYIVNEKYPWMFASVDKLMNIKGGYNIRTKEPLTEECPLEIKTMNKYVFDKFEAGIPTSYIVQIHVYMIILEVDYAEIACLVDGNRFVCYPIERSPEVSKKIIDISKQFWYNRVVPGKELVKKIAAANVKHDYKTVDDCEMKLQYLEPEPDNTEDYKKFMNERYLREDKKLLGNGDFYGKAIKYHLVNGIVRMLNKQKALLQNEFIAELSHNGCDVMDFDNGGRVSYKEKFNNGVKPKPAEGIILEHYNKLKL